MSSISLCGKYLFLIIFITLVTIMVILASVRAHKSPPARRNFAHVASLVDWASLGFLENRISHEHADQRIPPHTHWCKKFLAKREATPHSAPFIASIQLMTPDQGLVHYCAGTIIDEHWILTAAHCLTSPHVVRNSVIVAGAHDIHVDSNTETVQTRRIDHYVQHELYLGGVNPYDIALIYTREPLEFNEYVKPAKLPPQDEMPNGYGTLYGWGNVSMTSVPRYPHRLQEANMPILNLDQCQEILAESGLPLHETNLCTGPLNGGVSICTADSGGPLIQHYEELYEEVNRIIGIVSWGKVPCGQKNAPSVFVRVSAFTDWINQITSTATHIE